jgi:excisionase family DNA binding protein
MASVHLDIQDELREIVREEVARALKIGGADGYLSTEGAARYLDTTKQAISARVKRGELTPVRRRPRLFAREELDRWVGERP